MTTTFRPVGEVELDARRRVALASLKLKNCPNSRYRVEEGPDGQLRLIPVFSVSAEELAILRNPETMMRINESLDAAAAGEVVDFSPAEALAELDTMRHSDVEPLPSED